MTEIFNIRRSVAQSFRYDPAMEALAKHEELLARNPTLRIQVGHYEEAKAAARELGLPTQPTTSGGQ